MVLVALVLFVAPVAWVAPAAAQSATDAHGEVDLTLRYPSQVTFRVWGDGATYNEFFLEAAPGDSLETRLLLRVRGDNTLTGNATYRVVPALVIGDQVRPFPAYNGTIAPDAPRRDDIRLNLTLPVDLPEGTHTLRFGLETGAYDPNPDNNDADDVPLQVGRLHATSTDYAFRPGYVVGPLVLAALVVTPLGVRTWRRRGLAADQVPPPPAFLAAYRTRWAQWSTAWMQMDDARRVRLGLWLTLAGLVTAAVAAIIAAGGIGFGAAGVIDALFLAVITALAHVALGTLARVRRERDRLRELGHDDHVAWREHVPAALRAAGLTAALVFTGALFWQQLAAATQFFRWASPFGMAGFLVIGIRIGAIYALIALGYTMVYGILKFINFAHGEVFMWGAYFAWILSTDLAHWPLLLALVASVALTGLLGAGIERVAYRPLRGGDRLTPLVTAIAVSLLLQAVAQFLYGARKQTYTSSESSYTDSALRTWFSHDLTIFGIVVDRLAVTVLVSSIVLMIALHLFVRYARIGRAMRATADDMETARTIGINVDRVITVTFIVGSGLAAFGGVFYGLEFGLKPTMGLFVGIKAFTAAVIGGIGNIYGAFLGAFLVGIAENVGGQYIAPQFQKVITFFILVVFLIWRPQGILGSEVDRR